MVERSPELESTALTSALRPTSWCDPGDPTSLQTLQRKMEIIRIPRVSTRNASGTDRKGTKVKPAHYSDEAPVFHLPPADPHTYPINLQRSNVSRSFSPINHQSA